MKLVNRNITDATHGTGYLNFSIYDNGRMLNLTKLKIENVIVGTNDYKLVIPLENVRYCYNENRFTIEFEALNILLAFGKINIEIDAKVDGEYVLLEQDFKVERAVASVPEISKPITKKFSRKVRGEGFTFTMPTFKRIAQ